MRGFALALAGLALAGCGDSVPDYFPLDEGNQWTYNVDSDGGGESESMRVERKVPVGPYDGWLVGGDRGESLLAWHRGTLYASELGGTQFDPPLPLFSRAGAAWEGQATTPFGNKAGRASIKQSEVELKVGGQSYLTERSVVDLKTSGGRTQLTTWFFPRMGILRQEQRSGPALTLDRRISFVSGP